ncbi:peptidoglycan DD-metalloendopeptidase family protein [Bacillaceae bacterium W0354]
MKKILIIIICLVAVIGVTYMFFKNNTQTKTESLTIDQHEEDKIVKLESAEQFIDLFLNNQFKDIYSQTSDDFKSMVTEDQFKRMGEDFNKGIASYHLVSTTKLGDQSEYQWMSDDQSKGVRAYFSSDLIIEGILIVPIKANLESDNVYTENTYQMPINEKWYVGWGGTNELVNYHYPLESQRYAYDLLIVKDGYSYDGDPTVNENYYAFGKDAVAPKEGIVVATENSLKDNKPGVETNTENPLGNYVIIEHDHQEYSIIGHLKEGSLTVNEGDEVKAGDFIGLVGNSGNSSERHIHFQVSNGQDLFESQSLRIKFENNLNPIRGEYVDGF